MTPRPTASVSLDLDNLWAYLKTHGDPAWESRPSFLPTAVPRLLEALGGHGLRSTVFVVGADAARDDGAAAVAAFHAAGHEVANHSWGHEPWLHRYSPAELEAEVVDTGDAIVAAGAPRPVGFRGPGFSLTPGLVRVLDRHGYTYDSTALPTWIGPLARAFHNRSAATTDAGELFGPVSDAVGPLRPHVWSGTGVLELPVTTMPLARVPIHGSYLLQLHQASPRLALTYFRTALRLCLLRGVEPTFLLHPTDVLDATEAPGMAFFPGMAVPGPEKARLLTAVLDMLRERFDVVGTGEHAARIRARAGFATRDVARAGSRPEQVPA
ncbi:polysaccharide deacetylase family protein [Pseudonocardia phyllosphaerae]|uniref:polysaccharide deacetylase family protein n=1 Tax=Pseudonocardia phyllosphaerae TaxID=3390502 RepID=UPI00397A7F22